MIYKISFITFFKMIIVFTSTRWFSPFFFMKKRLFICVNNNLYRMSCRTKNFISLPLSLSILNCSGLKIALHSSSVLFTIFWLLSISWKITLKRTKVKDENPSCLRITKFFFYFYCCVEHKGNSRKIMMNCAIYQKLTYCCIVDLIDLDYYYYYYYYYFAHKVVLIVSTIILISCYFFFDDALFTWWYEKSNRYVQTQIKKMYFY